MPIQKEMLQKEIIVIGDIEMGAGNLTDDFISDKALSEVISSLVKQEHPVDLILNGDTLDFLKCPSQLSPTKYPRHITKDVSLEKLTLIYQAHKKVFRVLANFAAKPDKNVYFILGNHDHDLVYPEVQQKIRELLGNSANIHFPKQFYRQHGVYAEHGHQYDFLFAINFDKLFVNYKGQPILNFPFVSFGLISTFMHMKEEHPFLERIFPRPELFTHHRVIAKEINKGTLTYFLKSLVYYPFRFYSDPTYSFPTNLLRQFYKRLRTWHWEIDQILPIFSTTKITDDKIVVLGHIHEKMISKGENRTIIQPGSWRDEYEFNANTRELIPRSKRYVQIGVTSDGPQYQLIDYPLIRSIFDFDEVLKDEIKFVKQAAWEEGFQLKVPA